MTALYVLDMTVLYVHDCLIPHAPSSDARQPRQEREARRGAAGPPRTQEAPHVYLCSLYMYYTSFPRYKSCPVYKLPLLNNSWRRMGGHAFLRLRGNDGSIGGCSRRSRRFVWGLLRIRCAGMRPGAGCRRRRKRTRRSKLPASRPS